MKNNKNYYNRINSDSNFNNILRIKGKGVSNKNNYVIIGDTKTPSTLKNISNSNYFLIQNRDVAKLQKAIKPKKIIFYTYDEIYDYLNKQDLSLYLGVPRNYFNCIFHNDNRSKATIYKERNYYYYKCTDKNNCNFGTGTIRKCTERILKCNKVEGLDFLKQVYNITYIETEWQVTQKKILDENIKYMLSSDFKMEYPEVYQRIKNYFPELIVLHEIAKTTLPPEHYTEDQNQALFFSSLRYLGNIIGDRKNISSNHRRIADRLGLFTYLGLLFKLKDEEIPPFLLEESNRQKTLLQNKLLNQESLDKGKEINRVSFFSIPSYSENVLNFSEEKSIEFKESHFTMKGWSREMIFRALGEKEANRVYPQLQGEKISELNYETTRKIENICFYFLKEKGWTTEAEILQHIKLNFKGQQIYKDIQIKRVIPELIVNYGLKKVRLNKQLKEKYNINIVGYPYIIILDEDIHNVFLKEDEFN